MEYEMAYRIVVERPDLGPCCVCETKVGVRNLICLPFKNPSSNLRGWGCVVCDIPAVGAMAVTCDGCVDEPLKFICSGDNLSLGRIPYPTEEIPFDHDMSKHPESDASLN